MDDNNNDIVINSALLVTAGPAVIYIPDLTPTLPYTLGWRGRLRLGFGVATQTRQCRKQEYC